MEKEARFAVIADAIARHTGTPRQNIRLNTRVYHDVGLSGTDYYEFLVWFSNMFSVDLTGMDMRKLAPSEGVSFALWPRRHLELTVQDFVDLSTAASWKASGLDKRTDRR